MKLTRSRSGKRPRGRSVDNGRFVELLGDAVVELVPDADLARLLEEERPDDERDERDRDRVDQSRVDVAGRGHERRGDERREAAEEAVADVVRKRERRVANPGREGLDE